MEPAINPLCDKDHGSMSPKELVIEAPGEVNLINAYVCDLVRCGRCYNESAGYFDFIAGKLSPGSRQTLCQSDAQPMFLESVSSYNEEMWRCPWCEETVKL
jgi:hypothetical protein